MKIMKSVPKSLLLDKWSCLTSVITIMMITSYFTSFFLVDIVVQTFFLTLNDNQEKNTCLFAAFTQSTVFS